jgi:thiol-disulfide isomerase/thioredoxin
MMALDRRRMLATVAAGALAAAGRPARAAPASPGEAEGKAVVAVFWSTTCPYCRRHNAHVEKLRQAASGRPLELITIARDDDPATVQRLLSRQGWQFAVTLDQAAMRDALSTRNMIPLTVTVDRHGRLKQVIPGEMFEADVLDLLRLAA